MVEKSAIVVLSWISFAIITLGTVLALSGFLNTRNTIDDVIFVQFWISYSLGWFILISMSSGALVFIGIVMLFGGIVLLLISSILVSSSDTI